MAEIQQENRPRFSTRDQQEIKEQLGKLSQVPGVSLTGEFILDRFVLTKKGEKIQFGHPLSARAFLDAYLDGYNDGFAAGRSFENEDVEDMDEDFDH